MINLVKTEKIKKKYSNMLKTNKINKIYIYHHMGLGDHISCNGLVRGIIKKKKNKKYFLFCKKIFFESIKFMYRDIKNLKLKVIDSNNADIEVEKYLAQLKDKKKIIRIGLENYDKIYAKINSKNNPITYDMVFYKQMSVSYKKRFTDCYWKRNIKEENRVYKKLIKDPNKKYIFVHDDPSLNHNINKSFFNKGYKIIKNDKSEIIFNMAKVIENATEIHLMESSIRNMTESLNLKTKFLFLYIWRRKKMAPRYNYNKKKLVGTIKNWKIIYSNPKREKNIIFLLLELIQKIKYKFF